MPVAFEPTTPADLPAVTDLLRTAFQAAPDVPFLNPDLLRWKLWEAGPRWDGPRSYVLRQDGNLVSHGCVWPVWLRVGTEELAAPCLVDWVSAKGNPGLGIMLVRKMAAMAPVMLSIGGSDATRRIMPRIGFRECGELLVYARVLRPWKQFLTRPGGSARKDLMRMARNTAWSWDRLAAASGWTARPAIPEAAALASFYQGDGPASVHGVEFLAYMQRCPAAAIASFTLFENGRARGFFLFGRVRGQARILDLRIDSDRPEDWTAAYRAAVDAAKRDPLSCEVIAQAPAGIARQALEQNGFRVRDRRPIFVHDPENRLGGQPPRVGMLDDDSAAFDFPEYPYVT